jgi:protein-disulfide isomerase
MTEGTLDFEMRPGRIFLATLQLLFFVVFACTAQSPESSAAPTLGGSLDAPIRIEVFSDFECPACRTLYMDTIRQVLKDYCSTDKVCVVYHEFPLPMHKYAREAARYSLAAQRLSRNDWLSVVDALYSQQAQWSKDGSLEATVQKALQPDTFQKVKKMLQSPVINESIDRTIAFGQKRDVKSTPTLFITALGREQRVVGGIPYPVLKQYFDRIVR